MELLTDQLAVGYEASDTGAQVRLADGRADGARVVIAADGLHSAARHQLVGDTEVNSGYVAYRGLRLQLHRLALRTHRTGPGGRARPVSRDTARFRRPLWRGG